MDLINLVCNLSIDRLEQDMLNLFRRLIISTRILLLGTCMKGFWYTYEYQTKRLISMKKYFMFYQ